MNAIPHQTARTYVSMLTWAGKAEVPATDDWPFLWVCQYGIPDFYRETVGLIFGCSLLALLVVGIRPWRLVG